MCHKRVLAKKTGYQGTQRRAGLSQTACTGREPQHHQSSLQSAVVKKSASFAEISCQYIIWASKESDKFGGKLNSLAWLDRCIKDEVLTKSASSCWRDALEATVTLMGPTPTVMELSLAVTEVYSPSKS